MKGFSVEKEVMDGMVSAAIVASDGMFIGCPDDRENQHIVTGFSVYEFGDDGMTENMRFFPVKTDFATWENNEEEVLSKIKAEYQPGEWQNDDW